MSGKVHNVLFLCTGNTARSIIAEALLNAMGKGGFRAYSAGSFPKGTVHPLTLELIRSKGLPVGGLRSKSWDEFARPDAPRMDIIITVCDNAAGEVCPVWPGQPVTAHWGVPDPAAVEGTLEDKRQAFLDAYNRLGRRIEQLACLSVGELGHASLQQRLNEIGRSE
jgi:arsenate reductase